MLNSFSSGASSSINKSIRELEKISKGISLAKAGELREELRKTFRKKLISIASKWYKIGFKRGHKVCYTKYEKTGEVPKNLTKDMNAYFINGTIKKKVKLQSSITRKSSKTKK
ncbi:MAG: hypothetical protein NTY74_06170 [Ignavibacteriae bacterium]|nr:hypothetical protein [Ignavibacteriota bacterium]